MSSEQESVQDQETEQAESTLGPLAQQFVTLARSLLQTGTVAAVMQRIVHAARDVVPGAELVSVTLWLPDGSFATPVGTDPLAVQLDGLQYRHKEGPCVDATRIDGPGIAVSEDLGAGREWPRFGPAAAALGVGAVLATALLPGDDSPRLGALNIYSHQPHGLDQIDRDIALLLAAHASIALAATQAITAAGLETAQLREALQNRDVIGQAKGILMQRRGISATEAFEVLRRSSQELNIKLAELARTLSTRHTEL
ncbi:MAG TPA: ANTAR domain-containing protein [Pseudonocardiaceae bacterium]|nr:ANTAR domain-containing protein [Pseudonocardiaceae bacterium]